MEADKYRDDEWYGIVGAYLDKLEYWGIEIDHEDGSTAPFTSLALKDIANAYDYRQTSF